MDSKKQHDTMKEKQKLKTTFSVPVKKSDACNHGTTNEPKAKHKATCPENRLHLYSQGVLNKEQAMEPDQMTTTESADKQKSTGKPKKRKSDENVTQAGKKTKKPALQKNTFCGDKLHSTERHDEGVSLSSEADSISRTIAEVIGRTEQKSKNTSDDSQSFDENDVDNWDLKDTGVCEKSKRDGKRQLDSVQSKNMSQNESDGNIIWTPKSPQLIGNVSSDLSTDDEDSININDDQGEETGTWVECSIKVCNKWRYLADVEDPVLVPENWDCTMNSDKDHNSCDKPQVEYEESGHIYTKYTNGSVVWAKVDGYPWWPAMVECDPDTDMYYEVDPQSRMVPLEYHVSFFDDQVTRSWVRACCITPYKSEMAKTGISNGSFVLKKEIKAAMKNADRAFTLPLKDRLQIYGFQKRFPSMRSFKKEKRAKLHSSAKNIFVKSESLDYTRGVHKSASVRGCEPPLKKNVTKRRPLVNRINKSNAEQSKVCTPSDMKSNVEKSNSNTRGGVLQDKLSKTTSSLGNNSIKADRNHRNCDDKENNIHGSMDKAEKRVPDKKRKHQKQKLPVTDDGDKLSKKFMLKESNTNIIPDGTENNIKKNKSADSETLEKCNLHNQLHKTDRHELIKKSKLKDKKGEQTQKHHTVMQDSLKNVLLVQNTKTEEIRSHKKQNDNVEEFSATAKTSPCSKQLKKVRTKQQAAVSELSSSKKEEEIDSEVKITVHKHHKSAVMIAMKKSESNSDGGKEIKCSSNGKNTEQTSLQCENANGKSRKEDTNPDSANIVGKAASLNDRANPLDSKEVHINDSSESTREPVVKSKTGMKEVTGTVDFSQRKRDSKVRKCTNIVTETTALYHINILNPTNSVTFTDSNELCARDSLGLDDIKTAVTDQQVVPDMGTAMLTDCKSCPDLAFSGLSEKSVKSEITDHLVAKTLPDNSCEDDKDWGFDSVKLGVNCPQKILNDDSLDANGDDMMLDLDESIGVALEETNKGYSLHDDLRGDSFYEFESAEDVDFSEHE